jgi:hypothetical protein
LSEREEAAAIMKMSTLQGGIEFSGDPGGGRRFKGLKCNAGAMGQKLRLMSECHQWVLSERKIWTARSKIHVFITLPAIGYFYILPW